MESKNHYTILKFTIITIILNFFCFKLNYNLVLLDSNNFYTKQDNLLHDDEIDRSFLAYQ